MRIGVDARLVYHQPAGISRYTGHLLQAMAELDKEDEFIVFQHRKHKTPLIQAPNFRRATLISPVHHRIEQYALAVELSRFRLDLLHSTDFIPALYSPHKSVITVHDLAFLHYPHFLTTESAEYYGLIDRAVARANHIIVPSEHTRQDLIGQLGVPADKVSVIYEAANPSFVPLPFEETRREITAKYGIPETYIFSVGTIEPRKNITGLLHAFACLCDKYGLAEPVGLAIAGSKGWLYEETLETVRTLKLNDSVFFLGRVSDSDLNGASDDPSETREPFTFTRSTHMPGGVRIPFPSTAGSLTTRKERSTLCPAYAARLHVCGRQAPVPPETPVKPGSFSTTAATAPGS